MNGSRTTLRSIVLGAPDPRRLAAFYEALLGWTRSSDEPDWVRLTPPDGGTGIAFQTEPTFVAPVWPAREGVQQMNEHLDITVDSLDVAVERARSLGAHDADHQPEPDVRVMIDPVGHVFCLFQPGT